MANWLHRYCLLRGPQHSMRGQNHNWLPHLCYLQGPKVGKSGYIAPFSRNLLTIFLFYEKLYLPTSFFLFY